MANRLKTKSIFRFFLDDTPLDKLDGAYVTATEAILNMRLLTRATCVTATGLKYDDHDACIAIAHCVLTDTRRCCWS